MYQIHLKSLEEIASIRLACQHAARILQKICSEAKAGVTTQELDDYARELHREIGAIPAPLGYGSPPFPAAICTSLNEVICHGIPNRQPLKEGDILNIDVTCILDGFYGDCSQMVAIGEVTEEKRSVINASHGAMMEAIHALKPGEPLSIVGKKIEEHVAPYGFSIVYQFVGHGVGLAFHEPPQVLHHRNRVDIPLAEGMIFTVEPMINVGVSHAVIDSEDRWTARTQDGKPSAQWEHTVLIRREGHEILTSLPPS